MPVPKYTFIRNACFCFGVLVALLCVFPPPNTEHILLLSGYQAKNHGSRNSTTQLLTDAEENVADKDITIQDVEQQEVKDETPEVTEATESSYLKVRPRSWLQCHQNKSPSLSYQLVSSLYICHLVYQ